MRAFILAHKKLVSTVVLVTLCFVLYVLQTPSNNRTWTTDQEVLPYAEFQGTDVTVFNIRNFSYTTVDMYTPHYYTKTFNLNDLQSVDFVVEPFGSMAGAHTFLTFGFTNGDHVAISIEIRKEVGEKFSPLSGIFRQYELMYVVADEQDVIKLRSNYRKDQVYLYPLQLTKEQVQVLFVDMLKRTNALRDVPEFYNTITNNCTTNVAQHINAVLPHTFTWDVRLLFSEYAGELFYEQGLMGTTTSFTQLQNLHHINAKAEAYANSVDFSDQIRN